MIVYVVHVGCELLSIDSMIDLKVISNANAPLAEVLKRKLATADEFRVASAFLNSGGLDIVLPDIQRILENEGSVQVVHGADFNICDPSAVRSLVDLRERYGNFHYFVYCGWLLSTKQSFHPNLYITTSDCNAYTAIIGSSNLTAAGLEHNEEVNVVIRGGKAESPVRDCNTIFDRLVRSRELFEPNREFAERYEEFCDKTRELQAQTEPPDELHRFIQELLIGKDEVTGVQWLPETQLEVVIRALQILESNVSETKANDATSAPRTWPLVRIYAVAEVVARALNIDYDWSTFDNSVRARIYDHGGGSSKTSPLPYFERNPNRQGEYRLTDIGRAYTGG